METAAVPETSPGVPAGSRINNAWYDGLGERWYGDRDHAIALLRVEAGLKLDYVSALLAAKGMERGAEILDIGCGAGFVGLPLAGKGHSVCGIDLSESSLEVARRRVGPGMRAEFRSGDAYALDVESGTKDMVLMLDFLEHVEHPALALREAARTLKPGGLLVFHTFNRTWFGYLVGVLGPRILLRDTPAQLHVHKLFLRPDEVRSFSEGAGLRMRGMRGARPRFASWPFWSTLLRQRVHRDFAFTYTRSLAAGYLGHAEKIRHG